MKIPWRKLIAKVGSKVGTWILRKVAEDTIKQIDKRKEPGK